MVLPVKFPSRGDKKIIYYAWKYLALHKQIGSDSFKDIVTYNQFTYKLYICKKQTKNKLEKKLDGNYTSPGGNTPQDTNSTATCLLSRKLYKLDEPDMQDTAGEARTSS